MSLDYNLPVPFEGTDEQLRLFQSRKFDATDLVALSGEHTFGRSHCPITIDTNPPIDPNFKKQLEATCPNDQSLNTINLDITRRTKFDNMYYINLLNHQGVFPSDQDLASHPTTKEIVNLFASNQNEFSNKFANAFVKVSQLSVLIGNQGEIRKSCFAPSNRQSNNGVCGRRDDGKGIWRLTSFYGYPNGVGDMLLGTSFGCCPNRPLILGTFLVISTTSWMQVRNVVGQDRSNQLINGFCLAVMNYGLSDVHVED
ncbi:peroxidase family protein [Medicago truncatula]|uniref:peroxidase n=1 Tax=Medicago truncatula TaxID=3880 RepID=G7JXB4_MEDTR|nr:peroxidase family protein [Medicago truncatula]